MSDCLFCKIIDGSIPSMKVYEDEFVYAFMDIGPLSKGHTLLIPKEHVANIFEMSSEVASNLFAVAPKIANAIKDTFNPAGMNLVNNNGEAAGQTVFHFHLHFIPRYDETDGFKPTWTTKPDEYTPVILADLAEQIIENLNKKG
ncbi:HIT family protein [Viridibacillus sp. FSL R5-0477]|uniref:Protein hit n=1 Tax=Viridibacillus arenosi FSL R5-213 TaxID=1227360 RepID=W4END5_9BACL|nr:MULTISPECIES: HIT family protein [Viridibacillus]ETT82065.1 protein hit [Viridibacillus arenosi FSL R5-213]OMC81363.1 HIT family protein [Viridibacillus sp. FSL H8-0123]OMC86786.1 HIT family protein [Viridibacillus sp. FSL H7-0596]OMC90406.1 HIT family protein [Viridibacillus arenosi]